MSEAFSNDTLFDEACKHFGVPGGVASFAKPNKERAAKRQKISKTLDRFRKLMSGPNPPKTKQEAVRALSPIFAFLLSAFVRSVIEWLWDKMQEQTESRDSGR
jgi:hypothetical protein